MRVEKEGSVRVDLLGGTLDLVPINLIIPHVVTLNLATSLKAKVVLEKIDFDGVEIVSHDYDITKRFASTDFKESNFLSGYFGHFTFVAQIMNLLGVTKRVRLEMCSGAPAGSGLGGSSSMGVTLYSALCDYIKRPLVKLEAINRVQGVEGRILDSGPAGYQDYYPALFGGVLALLPLAGEVEVRQLFTPELKEFLEEHLTLVYTGETRLSGINNWEVYKGFFDKAAHIREGLTRIAELSADAYRSIEAGEFHQLLSLIASEGEERAKLFPGIMSPSMRDLLKEIRKDLPHVGIKVCGAGGGGCFLLTHKKADASKVARMVQDSGMRKLEFIVDLPLE